jgi:hypothetical protein
MTGKKNRSWSGMGTNGRKEDIRKGKGRLIWWMCFVFIYENRTRTPVEIVLRSRREDMGERWRV